MYRSHRLLALTAIYALIAGCLSPRPWWERELEAWVGASIAELEESWGPPRRTIIGESGRPVMVYESTVIRDPRDDRLRDPSQMVSDMPPSSAPQVDELDCSMFFEVEGETVVATRYDGSGCQVIPRPGLSPGS